MERNSTRNCFSTSSRFYWLDAADSGTGACFLPLPETPAVDFSTFAMPPWWVPSSGHAPDLDRGNNIAQYHFFQYDTLNVGQMRSDWTAFPSRASVTSSRLFFRGRGEDRQKFDRKAPAVSYTH